MEQKIKDRYHDSILQEATQRYGITPGTLVAFDSVENFVYGFEQDERSYILRVSHSLRRSQELIQAEVDWINYLAAGGVGVASAIRSPAGNLVELIADGEGGHFLVTAFVKAKGQKPWDLWTPALYETYGQLLGSMHALTQHYQPTNQTWKRPHWDDDLFEFVQRYLPDSESFAKQKYSALCDYLHTLPTDSASYGLLHQDAHGNNFLVDDSGHITLFDFDECAYSWFVNDIAIVLFHIALDAEDTSSFTGEFMTHFLRGYRQEKSSGCPLARGNPHLSQSPRN